jgi:ATP-dependent RNA helicase DeaD
MATFAEFGIKQQLLDALKTLSFETPTPIQQTAIPELLAAEGVHFIGLAQTGTGKTAAYGLPMLHKLNVENPGIQGLVLCPTRELCIQVADELQKFAAYMPVRIAAVYGGTDYEKQTRQFRAGVHILVATPGRLIDHIERGNLNFEDLAVLILDEADKMLEMGFVDDVDYIIDYVGQIKDIWLFSATMPDAIRRVVNKYMHNVREISMGRKNVAADKLRHVYYQCESAQRFDVLRRVIDFHPEMYGIVFTRTKNEAQDIAESLKKAGYGAESLHGDLQQAQRERVTNLFRQRHVQIMVATDVAARGLDIHDLTHVVHYILPDDTETYIHRTGRTARAGKSGVSISIVSRSQLRLLSQIEHDLGVKFEKELIPTAEQVVHSRIEHFLERFVALQPNETAVEKHFPLFVQKLETLSREEIIKRLCWHELDHFLTTYKNARDLNPRERKLGERSDRPGRKNGEDEAARTRRYKINIGERDNISKMELIVMLSHATGLPKSHINKVQVQTNYSFFELFNDEAEDAVEQLRGQEFEGRPVRVDSVGNDEGKRLRRDKSKIERNGHFISRGKYKYAD